MPRFSEETLNGWRLPPSDSEDEKLLNSERMIREAISADAVLSKMTIEVFGQGSYANDTNVRLNSDVDINVSIKDSVFLDLPPGKSKEDYGYIDSSLSFLDYKNRIELALVNYFGRAEVERRNKCIFVRGNTYRVQADVVPTFNLIRYQENGLKVVGTKFFSDHGSEVKNFPIQHIQNGKKKNNETQRRFKRLTRIMKRVRYKMIEDRIGVSDNITSFLIESLVWNVPNDVFNNNEMWSDRLRQAILYLYNATLAGTSAAEQWGEVSDLLYLFRERKWSKQDVNTFMTQMWTYLDFK